MPLLIIDTVVRLIPGVLGNPNSLIEESFEKNLLEYPQYTKPKKWEKKDVPDVLLSGDHAKIKGLAFKSIRGYNTTPTSRFMEKI